MGKSIPVRLRALGNTVLRENGCVEWTGGTFQSGYGRIYVDGQNKRAHRVVYELLAGLIPDGLTLDHLCRNILCVAPAHLEPVTDRENILRGTAPPALRARQTHCKNGHEFTEANTYRIPPSRSSPNGGRSCRRCAVAATQRWQAKHGRT